MKFEKIIATIFLAFLLFTINVKADCTSDKKSAQKVEILTETVDEPELLAFRIKIKGLESEMFAEVVNDINDEVLLLEYNENNEVYFDSIDKFKTINYKIKIKSKSCDEVLNEIDVKAPGYNLYSSFDICRENKSVDLCQSFYDEENMDYPDLEAEVLRRKEYGTLLYYVKEYYLYVLIPIVIGLIIFAAKVFILKRRKNHE